MDIHSNNKREVTEAALTKITHNILNNIEAQLKLILKTIRYSLTKIKEGILIFSKK